MKKQQLFFDSDTCNHKLITQQFSGDNEDSARSQKNGDKKTNFIRVREIYQNGDPKRVLDTRVTGKKTFIQRKHLANKSGKPYDAYISKLTSKA